MFLRQLSMRLRALLILQQQRQLTSPGKTFCRATDRPCPSTPGSTKEGSRAPTPPPPQLQTWPHQEASAPQLQCQPPPRTPRRMSAYQTQQEQFHQVWPHHQLAHPAQFQRQQQRHLVWTASTTASMASQLRLPCTTPLPCILPWCPPPPCHPHSRTPTLTTRRRPRQHRRPQRRQLPPATPASTSLEDQWECWSEQKKTSYKAALKNHWTFSRELFLLFSSMYYSILKRLHSWNMQTNIHATIWYVILCLWNVLLQNLICLWNTH